MKRLTLLMVFVVALGGMLPVRAQEGQRPPITAENAAQVTQVAMLGRGWVDSVAWSPNERTLAAAGSLGIWLYDVNNPTAEPRLLEGHVGTVYSVAWSPDGTRLASAGQNDVRIWDVATGESLAVLEHAGPVNSGPVHRMARAWPRREAMTRRCASGRWRQGSA
jgi:WD40 repeat protein